MHRREYWAIAVVAVGLVVAAVIGDRFAPGRAMRDPRRSALLTGPAGAKGLADALRRLGVDVTLRKRPLFGILEDASGESSGVMIALLDVTFAPTGVERQLLRDFVADGDVLLLSGRNGVEGCFGVRVSSVGVGEIAGTEGLEGQVTREGGVAMPPGDETLPELRSYMESLPSDSVGYVAPGFPDDCGVLQPNAVDTLLSALDGRSIAAKLRFGGGGTVILIADSHLLTNESFKETDAGLLVLDWILSEKPSRLIIDEYHQGFQVHGSVIGAAWWWVRVSPVGWAILQSLAAAVAAIGFLAVRFGPALPAVERKRRSPVEHVDALAAGLERCRGDRAAVNAFVSGLRRRLGARSARGGRHRGGLDRWLAGLALAVHTPTTRAQIAMLAELKSKRGRVDLVQAASTVEDLWEALGQQNRSEQL